MPKKEADDNKEHLQIDRVDSLRKKVEESFAYHRKHISDYQDNIVQMKLLDGNEAECKELEDFVFDIVNGISYGMMSLECEPLLAEYKTRNPIVISLSNTCENNSDYQRVYNNYLKILEKYKRFLTFPFPRQLNIHQKMVCKGCGKSEFDLVLDRSYVCQDCGETAKDVVSTKSSYRDTERTAATSRYKYFERSHFEDRMKEIQAEQKVVIKPELYNDLEEWLVAHKLVNDSSDYSEWLAANNKSSSAANYFTWTRIYGLYNDKREKAFRYDKVLFSHTLRFMKQSQKYKNYEDAVLIWSTHTGKKAPSFSHLEGDILDDYEQIQKVYHSLENKKRKSVPNAYIILYQILTRRGFKIDREFFSLSKGEDVVDWYNDILEEIFERLEWTYKPI